jgi:D-3-phosphoglycerate dehydrogenase
VCLVSDQGFSDINICYSSPRGDDLDTRLLRAMVIKGILEEITTARVNLVNADLLAKNRGLRISEVTVTSDGRCAAGVLGARARARACV